MTRPAIYWLTAGVLLAAGCGTAETSVPSGVSAPFTSAGSVELGPVSNLWGDGASGPPGQHLGCTRGRKLALLITVRNRTSQPITILGGGGPQPFRSVIERVAVQVRLAEASTAGIPNPGLRPWNDGDSSAVAIPPGGRARVQSNFLMRDCGSLQKGQSITVNRSVTLAYELGNDVQGAQPVALKSARIIVTRGPLHPKLPINTIG
jgi:hypothetical protein